MQERSQQSVPPQQKSAQFFGLVSSFFVSIAAFKTQQIDIHTFWIVIKREITPCDAHHISLALSHLWVLETKHMM